MERYPPGWLWWLDLFEIIEGNSNSIVLRNERWLDSSAWLQIEFSPVFASVEALRTDPQLPLDDSLIWEPADWEPEHVTMTNRP